MIKCNADERCSLWLDTAKPLFCLRQNANKASHSANKNRNSDTKGLRFLFLWGIMDLKNRERSLII